MREIILVCMVAISGVLLAKAASQLRDQIALRDWNESVRENAEIVKHFETLPPVNDLL